MTREIHSLQDVEVNVETPSECQWFLGCKKQPTHIMSHPILKWVFACKDCTEKG